MPFRQAIPSFALWLIGLALLTWLAAAAYIIKLDPEIQFFRHALNVKQTWVETLRRDHGAAFVVCGASSCAFSIDGERMLSKHGLPVANFGLHAGMEPLFLTAVATAATRPGDTLIVAVEPPLLLEPFNSPNLAAQMGLALGRAELIHASTLTGEPIHWLEAALSLRPGAYHFFTLLGKIALRRPLYRYAPRDLHPSGWLRTSERRPIPTAVLAGNELSPDARKLLRALKEWGETNRVQVVYSLPWAFVTPEQVPVFQKASANLLEQIMEFLPVLKDSQLGVDPVREHFADTEWHLTEEAAALRTDALADQLKHRRFWRRAELERLRSADAAATFHTETGGKPALPAPAHP